MLGILFSHQPPVDAALQQINEMPQGDVRMGHSRLGSSQQQVQPCPLCSDFVAEVI
jgi:hypothetical protein